MELLTILAVGALVIVTQVPAEASQWIASGEPIAADGEFPHHVYIKYLDEQWHCEGSLIGPQHVLVAGHCVGGFNINSLQIVVGDTQLNQTNGISIKNITFHPNFLDREPYYLGDIAVIQLTKNIIQSHNVKPINLPEIGAKYPEKTYLSATGFGLKHRVPIKMPTPLLKRTFIVRDNSSCAANWWMADRILVEQSVICVKSIIENQCFGDSGAIFINKLDEKNPILVGISIRSHYDDCSSEESYPDLVVKVSHYVDWIRNVMSSHSQDRS